MTLYLISLFLSSLLLWSIIPTPCLTAPTEISQTLPFSLAYSKLHYSWGLHMLLDNTVLLLLSIGQSVENRGQKALFAASCGGS